MTDLITRLDDAVKFIRSKVKIKANVGIVLGTGLGGLSKEVIVAATIPFNTIPHMGSTSADSHKGQLIVGVLGKTPVLVMDGRLHGYEGHSAENIAFPVRLLAHLGCKKIVLSNAAGGLNLDWKQGDIAVLEDHINLPGFCGVNPLVGLKDDKLGPRILDMSEPYSRKLIKLAREAAKELDIKLRKGTYVMVFGPNLETAAEYRFLRGMGADLVGMSTLPEVIAAKHMGADVVAFSIVTDLCDPDHLEAVDLPRIIKAANAAEPKLTKLVKELVSKL
ncbi:MAG: purine-nucleoside phosphorylase [Planctomycetes bacterium]|nr:purine-nucleoside phosphorylase [Planctomycetota bacterium]